MNRQGTFLFCLLQIVILFLQLAGCSRQLGKYQVSKRVSFVFADKSGVVDVLYGHSTAALTDEMLPLLTVIACVPGRILDKVMRTGGDGTSVSALNVDVGSNGPPDFGYGMIWNRTDDRLAINDTEFVRSDGNVFIVYGGPDYYKVHQLKLTLDKPMQLDELLGVIARRVASEELPEEVRRTIEKSKGAGLLEPPDRCGPTRTGDDRPRTGDTALLGGPGPGTQHYRTGRFATGPTDYENFPESFRKSPQLSEHSR